MTEPKTTEKKTDVERDAVIDVEAEIAARGDLSRIMKLVAGVGAVLTIGALATSGAFTAFSVAIGALIALSNLWVLGKIIASVLPPPDTAPSTKEDAAKKSSGTQLAWTAFAFVKILVLFGGIWILLTRGIVSPLGLAVGYGSLFIGIALSTMFSGMRAR